MLFHERHKDNTRSSQQLINAHIEVTQPHHAKGSSSEIKDGRNGQKEQEPHGSVAGRCGTNLGWYGAVEQTPGLINTAVHWWLVLLIRFARFVVVTRKGDFKIKHHFVHDQPKKHAHKHAKGLEQRLGKDFHISINTDSV